ncbi:MAG: TRAP transporter TatT component family protein [Spirochaetaceae bacterium]|jgi:predicted anti-sigma-YlaC factor YlaD|nr:TRAP transporter TatT component family protein [Spirochaetaceae bacterium]
MKTMDHTLPPLCKLSHILWAVFVPLCMLGGLSACSLNKLAINKISDALTGGGSNATLLGDTDPQLVGDALPFAVKMYEILLEKNPGHPGLILTTGSLLIMYANAFVQGPAEMLPVGEYTKKIRELDRAKKLYLRGAAILERGINTTYPGLVGRVADWRDADPARIREQLRGVKKEDVALLYWYAAGNLSAYALAPFDLDLGTKVPLITLLVERAYELDPDFNQGALDDFYILFYASLPEGMGGDMERAKIHYGRALEKSKGLSAGPYVSYARAVAIPAQDYPAFRSNLEAALAIDIEVGASTALVNIINQEKARYLLERAPELFADFDEEAWDENSYAEDAGDE